MNQIKKNLPEELINKIEDMVCKKRVNGDKKSNELLLVFELNENATNVHDILVKWLLKCLDNISDKVFDGYDYHWNIISQIKDNDWEDDDLEDNDTEKIKNSIIVAIHIDDDSLNKTTNDGLTIPYNFIPEIMLMPKEIMDCLTNEPNFVTKIGVSAVSSEVMKYYWSEMISLEPNIFSIAGEGYMVHRMWRKWKDLEPTEFGEWSTVREWSYRFGWNNYMTDK